MYVITDYGARDGAATTSTAGIQRAIDACHERGGGTVRVPAGVFVTGCIELKSNVNLHLDAGAILRATTDLAEYRRIEPLTRLKTLSAQTEFTSHASAVIFAHNAENVSITGKGTIHGNGLAFIEPVDKPFVPDYVPGWHDCPHYWFKPKPRPQMTLAMIECRNVRITDVRLLDSVAWSFVFFFCDGVEVRGSRIESQPEICNADGIDLISSRNVRISNCDLRVSDDAICLKNAYLEDNAPDTYRRPCENIAVSNCTIATTCNGFKFGTDSEDGFHNITFANSTIRSRYSDRPEWFAITGVSLECVDGGSVRNVTVSNIIMEHVRSPIFLRLGNRGRGQRTPTPGVMENISIDNVIATGTTMPIVISGIPEARLRNVSLSNVYAETMGGAPADWAARRPEELADVYPEAVMFGPLPTYGLFARHVEDLRLNNVRFGRVKADARAECFLDDISPTPPPERSATRSS